MRINFKKLIGNNFNEIIKSILDFDPQIHLYFSGFAGTSLKEVENKINKSLDQAKLSKETREAVRISFTTRNYNYDSIQKFLQHSTF